MMPWYRVDGVVMHLHYGTKGNKNAPPQCLEKIESGETCLGISLYQCDWKMGGGKTCDRHICEHHAQQVAEDKHLCPAHQAAYLEWKARREEETHAAQELPQL